MNRPHSKKKEVINPNPPDFLSYHSSLANELNAVKNRIRSIIGDAHWLTDGEFKESVLRTVIRRHIPESMLVGRGFIATDTGTSTQIDILIVDGNAPTLFKDGDLMIVTPDAVKAVIEVKTALKPMAEIREAVQKVAEIGKLCHATVPHHKIWTGLFVYDDRNNMWRRQSELLRAVQKAFKETQYKVNCMAYGERSLIRYWEPDAIEYGHPEAKAEGESWRSYEIDQFAPSYFIGNLLDAISGVDRHTSSYAWFPVPGGKYVHRTWLLPIDAEKPIRKRL